MKNLKIGQSIILAASQKNSYYDIYIKSEDDVSGYSVFVVVKPGENPKQKAIDSNLLDSSEVKFIKKVTKISKENYDKAIKA